MPTYLYFWTEARDRWYFCPYSAPLNLAWQCQKKTSPHNEVFPYPVWKSYEVKFRFRADTADGYLIFGKTLQIQNRFLAVWQFNGLIKGSVGVAGVPECFGWGSGGAAPDCCSQSCRPRRPELHVHRSPAGCWRSPSGLCSAPSGWPAHCSTPVRLQTKQVQKSHLKA